MSPGERRRCPVGMPTRSRPEPSKAGACRVQRSDGRALGGRDPTPGSRPLRPGRPERLERGSRRARRPGWRARPLRRYIREEREELVCRRSSLTRKSRVGILEILTCLPACLLLLSQIRARGCCLHPLRGPLAMSHVH